MRLSGMGEFEVTRQVYLLLRAGVAEITEQDTGPIPRRTTKLTRAVNEVAEVYDLALREMVGGLEQVQKSNVMIQAARDFLADEATGKYAKFYQSVTIGPDGGLDMPRLFAAVAEAGLDVQQLSDALSELMFFMLFTATEVLGRRRGDDLARRVKMIHGMLTTAQTKRP